MPEPDLAGATRVFKKICRGHSDCDKHALIASHGNVDYGLFDKLDKNKDGQIDMTEW